MSFLRPVWLAELRRESSLARAATVTLFAAVWLTSIQTSLSIDPTTSLHELLRTGLPRITASWADKELEPVVWIALVSRVFFYMFYARFLWLAAQALGAELRRDRNPVDLISMFIASRSTPPSSPEQKPRTLTLDALLKWASVGLLIASMLTTVLAFFALTVWPIAGHVLPWLERIQEAFDVGAAVLFVCLLAVWLFDIGHPDRFAQSTPEERITYRRLQARAVLRHEIADIAWRGRYSLGAIGFFAALTLVMNQGKDVLVGLSQASSQGWHGVLSIILTIASIWMFAHACYLWPRVLARTRRPSTAPMSNPTPESHIVAKWWARILGAAPMLILTLLSGAAAQSAFSGGARGVEGGLIIIAAASACCSG
jgi:hypothetical protein